jgi:hypothetical protein
MNKKEELTNDVLIADALIRLQTLEDMLVAKGIFTKEEYFKQMEVIATQIQKVILQNANVPGDLDEIVKSFNNITNKNQN